MICWRRGLSRVSTNLGEFHCNHTTEAIISISLRYQISERHGPQCIAIREWILWASSWTIALATFCCRATGSLKTRRTLNPLWGEEGVHRRFRISRILRILDIDYPRTAYRPMNRTASEAGFAAAISRRSGRYQMYVSRLHRVENVQHTT